MASSFAAPLWRLGLEQPAAALPRSYTEGACESPCPGSPPPTPPTLRGAAPTLLDATLLDVSAALAGAAPRLPRHTSTLLRSLFPSCAALCASTASPDSLGGSVLTLLEPSAAHLQRGGGAGELAAALPGGRLLWYSLAARPSAFEAALMQAFADALADALSPAAALESPFGACQASPPPEPCTPPPASPAPLPSDCFWESVSFGRSKGVDKPLRSTQGPTSKPAAETRRAALQPTLACVEEKAVLLVDDLAPLTPHPTPSWHAHPHAACNPIDELAGAGRQLSRLLDAVAGALAGRQAAVPAHVEALLARLFPAATSISAAMPTPDGQAITCTTLLHPGASAAGDVGPMPQRLQHSEPLGAGVCSWRLAAPPTEASLRLMRALAHQLEARLGAAALACRLGKPHAAVGLHARQAQPALAFAAAPPAGDMPQDCFWGSY